MSPKLNCVHRPAHWPWELCYKTCEDEHLSWHSFSQGCSSVAVSDWNVHVVLLGVHVHDPDEPPDRTRPEPKSSHRRQVLLGRKYFFLSHTKTLLAGHNIT